MVYNTGSVVAYEQFNNGFFYVQRQVLWAIIGFIVLGVILVIDIKRIEQVAPLLLGAAVILLFAVLIPGVAPVVNGSRGWINVPIVNTSFQVSEFAKLAIVIYLAYLVANSKQKKLEFPYKQFGIVLGLLVGLVALEPDLGTAILIAFSGLAVFTVAGADWRIVAGLIGGGGVLGTLFAFTAGYRSSRILDFIKVYTDPDNISYHLHQIFIALGSGGLLGVGLGQSRQKYRYIPEVTTDSIFAVLGEELGFIGVVVLILVLMFIIWRGFSIAANSKDEFQRLVALGLTTNIAIQTLVNIGGLVGAMPFTGVPLPFISYGGTSLVFLLASVGIIVRIATTNKLR